MNLVSSIILFQYLCSIFIYREHTDKDVSIFHGNGDPSIQAIKEKQKSLGDHCFFIYSEYALILPSPRNQMSPLHLYTLRWRIIDKSEPYI